VGGGRERERERSKNREIAACTLEGLSVGEGEGRSGEIKNT
jgi:hypothetical protein